jgi:hypothetical protein
MNVQHGRHIGMRHESNDGRSLEPEVSLLLSEASFLYMRRRVDVLRWFTRGGIKVLPSPAASGEGW